MTLSAPDPTLVQDIVDANRILAHQGIVDAFGHVSARHDQDPQRFLLARNMAPAQVRAEDILQYSLDGTPLDAGDRRVYVERFIHGAIYRARPDVMGVVHSHSASVLPFTISQRQRLRPVCHMGGVLGVDVPMFEIRDTAGDASDLLIRDDRLGSALATSLGQGNVVLMRGHGSTTVGPSVKVAVFRAYYSEFNARVLLQALSLGEVEYLTPGEAEATARSNEGQVERPWNLWKAAAYAAT